MMAVHSNLKRLFRFSIATLLFLMLCLGGYLSGYRAGFKTGAQDASAARLVVRTYPVGDLVISRAPLPMPRADFDSLIDLIVTTIAPETWMSNGVGEGEIQPFPANLSLVISQTQATHVAIAKLLERLRKLQTRVEPTKHP